MKKEALLDLDDKQLIDQKKQFCDLAFKDFCAACKVADSQKKVSLQIKLRGDMALCHYLAGYYLEAQLYALATIRFIMKHSNQVTMEELGRAQEILHKTQGKINTPEPSNDAPAIVPEFPIVIMPKFPLVVASTSSVTQAYSYHARKEINKSIDEALEQVTYSLMIQPNRSLVSYAESHWDILQARQLGARAQGITEVSNVMVDTGSRGTQMLVSVVGEPAMAVLIGPLAPIIMGVGIFVAFAWFNYNLSKYTVSKLEETVVRARLNAIMTEAVEAYDTQQYQQCWSIFSKPYNEKGDALVSLKNRGDTINPEQIIDRLSEHGIKPDGIAYLFNLLGIILLSGQIKIPGISPKRLREQAYLLFAAAGHPKLEAEAKTLDRRVTELRQQTTLFGFNNKWQTIRDFLYGSDRSGMAKEFLHAANKMPFFSRLEEIRNLSKLNMAIIHIIDSSRNDEELESAKQLIQEVRRSIDNHYQFAANANRRLEALDDFLWVMYGEQPVQSALLLTEERSEQLVVSSQYLVFLSNQLDAASQPEEKMISLVQIGDCYCQLAEKNQKEDHQSSLLDWHTALGFYQRALKINAENIGAGLGYMRCLLHLSKYNQMIDFFRDKKQLREQTEAWVFQSVALRKKQKYLNAKGCIMEALQRNHRHALAQKELRLVDMAVAAEGTRNTQALVALYDVQKPLPEEHHFVPFRSDAVTLYKILSIDGGGIRGILPAIWLSEIEKQTRKPIAHLFHMLCGTSTGAVLSAGLAAPSIEEEIVSLWKPRYSASDLLTLYTTKAQDIFTRSPKKFTLFSQEPFKPKYTKKGRFRLFKQYFQQTKLSESLVDLVIPATCEEKAHETFLFTKYEGASF